MSQPKKIQYVGFSGFGNLGDDALRQAVVEGTNDLSFFDAPLGKKALLRSGIGHYIRARGAPALLGGGTVLGRTLVRTHLKRIDALYDPVSWEMLGAGVEDPDFRGTRTYTSDAELELWRPLLTRFRKITVRGPQSREILARHGIESTVVGDPALLFEPTESGPVEHECDVLINATCGEDQWGGIDLDWTPALAESVRPLVADGIKVQFVSMEPTDDAWNERVARLLGIDPVIHRPEDARAFCSMVTGARVMLGARLHCSVLAAASGTVPVSLEYRPKNLDFMSSVSLEGFCHRVDRLEPDELRASILQILQNPETHRRSMAAAVDGLRRSIRAELVDVQRSLCHSSSESRR
jgi:hypothetical protein